MKSQNLFTSIDEAVEMLSGGIVDITFVKKTNGQLRTMHCTLKKSSIPYGEYNTVDSVIMNAIFNNRDWSFPLPVWDLYNSGWRSFYLYSTMEIRQSLLFGDTPELIEEMVQEKSKNEEDEELSNDTQLEIIENVTQTIKKRISTTIEEAPEKVIDFTENKIKQIVTNLVSRTIKGL